MYELDVLEYQWDRIIVIELTWRWFPRVILRKKPELIISYYDTLQHFPQDYRFINLTKGLTVMPTTSLHKRLNALQRKQHHLNTVINHGHPVPKNVIS